MQLKIQHQRGSSSNIASEAPSSRPAEQPETDSTLVPEMLTNLNSNTLKEEATIKIIAGKLFNPYIYGFEANNIITVSCASGLITDIRPFHEGSKSELLKEHPEAEVVDLSSLTVLPGFVDTHVHMFLHPYSETSWDDQLLKETVIERTIRATNHARETLLAGFTTVRDLGTEGAGDADIALRKCLSGPNAIIPGPRYFCANRAIVTTGSYGPKSELSVNQEGAQGITGAEAADGIDECRKVVRRQIGAGADWIKIYADYRYRSRMQPVASAYSRGSITTFSPEEIKTIIDTAHRLGVKVAAHSSVDASIKILIDCGVDTIEHGYDMSKETLDALANSSTVWVPTLAAYYTTSRSSDSSRSRIWEAAQRTFKAAIQKGVKVACGGDTGVFSHGQNALELQLMVQLGADYTSVLRWATLGGWECIRPLTWEGPAGQRRIEQLSSCQNTRREVGDNEMAFGALKIGFSADIIALKGDLEGDFCQSISAANLLFVMKAGKIYKRP